MSHWSSRWTGPTSTSTRNNASRDAGKKRANSFVGEDSTGNGGRRQNRSPSNPYKRSRQEYRENTLQNKKLYIGSFPDSRDKIGIFNLSFSESIEQIVDMLERHVGSLRKINIANNCVNRNGCKIYRYCFVEFDKVEPDVAMTKIRSIQNSHHLALDCSLPLQSPSAPREYLSKGNSKEFMMYARRDVDISAMDRYQNEDMRSPSPRPSKLGHSYTGSHSNTSTGSTLAANTDNSEEVGSNNKRHTEPQCTPNRAMITRGYFVDGPNKISIRHIPSGWSESTVISNLRRIGSIKHLQLAENEPCAGSREGWKFCFVEYAKEVGDGACALQSLRALSERSDWGLDTWICNDSQPSSKATSITRDVAKGNVNNEKRFKDKAEMKKSRDVVKHERLKDDTEKSGKDQRKKRYSFSPPSYKQKDALMSTSDIPVELQSTELFLEPSFIVASTRCSGLSNISRLETILLDDHDHDTSMPLTRDITRALLDSMRFEYKRNPAESLSNYTVRPMPREKKPVQNPASVRDFALLQISALKDSEAANFDFMSEIDLAFRLAAHFVIASCSARRREKGSSKKVRNEKTFSNAIINLILCLRGFLVKTFDLVGTDDSKQRLRPAVKGCIESFYCHQKDLPFSAAELLVFDIVTILVGNKIELDERNSKGLIKKLLRLDTKTRLGKEMKSAQNLGASAEEMVTREKLDSSHCNNIISDRLAELLFRQLLSMDTSSNGPIFTTLLKECPKSSFPSGALASTLPSMTTFCKSALNDLIKVRRDRVKENLDVQSESGEHSSRTESWQDDLSSHSSKMKNIEIFTGEYLDDEEDLSLLRIDGCMYLSKILDFITGQKFDSLNNNINHEKSKLGETAFFLFHTLMENCSIYERNMQESSKSSKECNSRSLRRRENLKSGVLSALALAGKFQDCPIKMKKLIGLVKKVPFLDTSFLGSFFRTARYKRRSFGDGYDLSTYEQWGEPSLVLMKEYEFHLMSIFGFVPPDANDYLSTEFHQVIIDKLSLSSDAATVFENMHYETSITHSALCLLQEPHTLALVAYHQACMRLGESPVPDFFGEKEEVVLILSKYISEVRVCVDQRRKELDSFEKIRDTIYTTKDAKLDATPLLTQSGDGDILFRAKNLLSGSNVPTDFAQFIGNIVIENVEDVIKEDVPIG
jgi:hypothetical protein